MGASGLRGGGLTTLIAVGTQAGVMVFDSREHPEWALELGVGGIGFGAGFLGTGTQHHQPADQRDAQRRGRHRQFAHHPGLATGAAGSAAARWARCSSRASASGCWKSASTRAPRWACA
jgi:hypothetical protein